jgi:hypothetical protein
MGRRAVIWLCALAPIALACSEEPTVTGAAEQWVVGKRFSIQVSLERQQMQLKNHSSGGAKFSPLLLVGRFRDAGRRTKLLTSSASELTTGEQFSVPVGSQLGAQPQDPLSELRVEIGEAAEKEIFLVR